MSELSGVIEELTEQMTAIFAQQFKLLNESFQETFLELFGGGKAQLELEDEKDILNCGIEIEVQPPGQAAENHYAALRRREGLCGHRPVLRHSEGAPHAVLRHGRDRGGAGRRPTSVRYARYMRRIAGKTQFIVITHRRGTMEEADVLYGVTMQEQGVSRILTINLNDMAKELHIVMIKSHREDRLHGHFSSSSRRHG